MRSIAFAAAASILIQPVVFLASFVVPAFLAGASMNGWEWRLSLLAAAVAAPLVLFVGVPSFLLLRRFRRPGWKNMAALGFTGAAVPVAAITWPAGRYPGYSSGGSWHGSPVEYFVSGVPTFYGWMSYIEGILFFGVHGLASAFVFLAAWRALGGLDFPAGKLLPR